MANLDEIAITSVGDLWRPHTTDGHIHFALAVTYLLRHNLLTVCKETKETKK